jgi:C4-dicarboxylate-specific signal transduction histidine kinase
LHAQEHPHLLARHLSGYRSLLDRELLAELERILLERENQQLRTRLEHNQRLTAIGTVAAGVAHEIKNPLTFVRGNLHVAGDLLVQMGNAVAGAGQSDISRIRADDGGLETGLRELEELIRDARTGVEQISAIVKDLGLLARTAEESLEPVSVSVAVDSAIRMAAQHIHRRARLVRDYRNSPSVIGDHARLTQVFLNLLVNACQALPEGRASSKEIRVRIRSSEADAVVEIEDTGSGIDPRCSRGSSSRSSVPSPRRRARVSGYRSAGISWRSTEGRSSSRASPAWEAASGYCCRSRTRPTSIRVVIEVGSPGSWNSSTRRGVAPRRSTPPWTETRLVAVHPSVS